MSTRRRSRNSSRTFTQKHYKSNDGFLTAIWGPPVWHFLHTLSFNYPVSPTKEQQKHYRQFLLSLRHVLPCGKCRENLKKNLKALPPDWKHFSSRDAFSRYIFNLHEKVNTMLGKKSGLTYEDVRDRYEHFRARCATHAPEAPPNENGCVHPLGDNIKSRCLLKIVPQTTKCDTLTIDPRCSAGKKTA